MEEINFLNVAIEKRSKLLERDGIIFIFEVNKEFLESSSIEKLRGRFCNEFPALIEDKAIHFEERILKFELNILDNTKDLIIENDNEFTLIAKDLEVKGNISSELLSKLHISSLKDIKSKYYGYGKLFIVNFDENREHIDLLLESAMNYQIRELIV